MKRDKKQNELLEIFSNSGKKTWDKRVTYKVGVTKSKSLAKTIVLVDECDAIMFKDLHKFYKATAAKNVFVIGFTATAFDGKETGVELKALDSLGYKVYRSCSEDQIAEPTIHEKCL